MRPDEVSKGSFYVNKDGWLVREILDETDDGDVHWRDYSLPEGAPMVIWPHRCSKQALARWAGRQATPEEVAKLQREKAAITQHEEAAELIAAALSRATEDQLLAEACRRGLHLRGGAASKADALRGRLLDPFKLIKYACRESMPGQVPRLTREELEAAVSRFDGRDPAEVGAVDVSYLNLREIELHGAILNESNDGCRTWTGACLQGADLESANLEGADLGGANLRGAQLAFAKMGRVGLSNAHLEDANLGGAVLDGAVLIAASLREASLWHTSLNGSDLSHADLRDAHVSSSSFRDANLRCADLSHVDLTRVGTGALRGISLHRATLDHTLLRRTDLGSAIGEEVEGEYSEAREVYLALKRNFEDVGDYDAAGWAYTKERVMEKACSAPWRARRFYGADHLGDSAQSRVPAWSARLWWFYARHTAKWLTDWVVEAVCGYGESIARVLVCLVVLVFAVAPLVVSLLGGILWSSDNASAYLHMPTAWQRFWYVYNAYLLYDLDVLTTASFSGLAPANQGVRMASGLLALLCIFLTGLLGFVAANRIRRS